MSYQISYDPDAHLILVNYEGIVENDTVSEIILKIIPLAREHDCYRILSDFRNAKPILSTVQFFNLPERVFKLGARLGIKLFQFKRALVVSDRSENLLFFETVSQNRRQNVRLFTDIDEAKKWLAEK